MPRPINIMSPLRRIPRIPPMSRVLQLVPTNLHLLPKLLSRVLLFKHGLRFPIPPTRLHLSQHQHQNKHLRLPHHHSNHLQTHHHHARRPPPNLQQYLRTAQQPIKRLRFLQPRRQHPPALLHVQQPPTGILLRLPLQTVHGARLGR